MAFSGVKHNIPTKKVIHRFVHRSGDKNSEI
jgi:hypothetical protein